MRRMTIAALCGVMLASCEHATNVSALPPQPALGNVALASGYGKLYSFRGFPGGATPTNLTLFSGALYGTTINGGAYTFGSIFKRSTAGVREVYSFQGGNDGAGPTGAIVALGGNLYGTTQYGGATGDGTVFAFSAQGTERVVYTFKGGTDGATPNLGGLLVVNGKLYGTTSAGGDGRCSVIGSFGCGIVFSVTPSGVERVLYRFRGEPDGASPIGTLIDANGKLYGTTAFGGTHGNGSVFTIDTSGVKHGLYSFKGFPDGADPYAGVTEYNGSFYGTTAFGGSADYSGTVYVVSAAGKEQVLHSFSGYPDGAVPYDSITVSNGVLYGTTQYGGADGTRCTGHGLVGCGIVFSLTTAGKEDVIYTFKGPPDGSNPWAGLVSQGGKLYGTTVLGGSHGEGSIFSIEPSAQR